MVQAQEQPPETQRTVVLQEPGSPPRGSPTSTAAENFELSPEKTGLINVGSESEPVYVYHDHLKAEQIQDLSDTHGLNAKGKKMIKDDLENLKHDLTEIASHINLPIELTSKLSEQFPDSDDTRIACFVYMSFLFTQLNIAEEDEIKSLEALVIDVSEYIFPVMAVEWTEKVFEFMTRRGEFSQNVMEEIYKKVMGSEMDIGAIFMFERRDLPPLENKADDGDEGGDDDEGDDKDEGGDGGGGDGDDGGEDDDDGGDDKEESVEVFKKRARGTERGAFPV
jgi:hypothetical protein